MFDINSELSASDSLILKYKVSPVNIIIIHNQSIESIQLLFYHLF